MTQRSRLIIALALAYFTYGMLLNTVGTVILRSVASLGVSQAQAGWYDGFKDISIAVVSFITASYLPRIGLKRAMQAGLALSAAACVMMAVVPAYAAICLQYMLVGTSFAFIKVGVYALIGHVTDDARSHASLTSVIEGCFAVGVVTVTVLFSLFVGSGVVDNGRDWLNVYWILAAICALALAVLSSARVEEAPAETGADTANIAEMMKLAALPLVLVFIFCAFTYVFIEQGIGTWLPTFNNQVLKLPQSMSVIAGTFYTASIAGGRLLGGGLIRRFGWFRVVMVSLAAVACTILAIAPLSRGVVASPAMDWFHAPIAAYLFLAAGAFLAPIYPTIVSVLSASPKARHTELMGLVVIFSALGGTAGSRLMAYLFGHLSGAAAFQTMVVPAMVLALGITLLRRQQLAAEAVPKAHNPM